MLLARRSHARVIAICLCQGYLLLDHTTIHQGMHAISLAPSTQVSHDHMRSCTWVCCLFWYGGQCVLEQNGVGKGCRRGGRSQACLRLKGPGSGAHARACYSDPTRFRICARQAHDNRWAGGKPCPSPTDYAPLDKLDTRETVDVLSRTAVPRTHD